MFTDTSEARFAPALQNSANLIPDTGFYFKLKFSVEILKGLRQQGYFIKLTVRPSFTRLRVIGRINAIQ